MTFGAKQATPYCRNICQKFDVKKIRNGSIYEHNARCHNCEAYIPRDKLLDKDTVGVKARCPCCNKPWLKGVHIGMGMKRITDRNKQRRLRQAATGIRGNLSLAI